MAWIATHPIFFGSGSGFVRGFNPGETVPDSVIYSFPANFLGRVIQIITEADLTPYPGDFGLFATARATEDPLREGLYTISGADPFPADAALYYV